MRILGAGACLNVALDCAFKAAGAQPQFLFADSALWVWWLVAVFWAGCVPCFLFGYGAKD